MSVDRTLLPGMITNPFDFQWQRVFNPLKHG
jgi:hypothetical protein